MVSLAPRWEDSPTRLVYTWTTDGWAEQDAPAPSPGRPRSEVLLRPIGRNEFQVLPLEEAWGPFLPDVPPEQRAERPYAWPATEAWWPLYAEPVDRFLAAAGVLSEAITTLGAELDEEREPWEDWMQRVETARALLGSLLRGISPTLIRNAPGEPWEQAFRSKSLLASYALMAYLDLLDGKRILACPVCGRPFATSAYQARYCSERCRNTATKRAYRHRLRERAATYHVPGQRQEGPDADDED